MSTPVPVVEGLDKASADEKLEVVGNNNMTAE